MKKGRLGRRGRIYGLSRSMNGKLSKFMLVGLIVKVLLENNDRNIVWCYQFIHLIHYIVTCELITSNKKLFG